MTVIRRFCVKVLFSLLFYFVVIVTVHEKNAYPLNG